MAGATLIELRRLVRAEAGLQATDALFTDTDLNDLINAAIDAIESEHRWPWNQVTATAPLAAGATSISLPADWEATRALFIGDEELEEVAISDLLAWGTDHTGQPQVWAQDVDAVRVRPAPQEEVTVTHVYYRTTTPLSADTDTTAMPAKFARGAVASKAAELAHHRQGSRPQAEAKSIAAVQWITRMRRAVRGSTRPIGPRIRPGSWL